MQCVQTNEEAKRENEAWVPSVLMGLSALMHTGISTWHTRRVTGTATGERVSFFFQELGW
jgi:hypothetical protein